MKSHNYRSTFSRSVLSYTKILCLVFLFAVFKNYAQEMPAFEKSIYVDSAGNTFINEKMEIYLFFAPDADPTLKHLISSSSGHANPINLQGHGEHFITHHDPVSGERTRHKVFADAKPPISRLEVTEGLIMQFNERFYCDGKITVEIHSEDKFSGVKKTLYSFDNSKFSIYDRPFEIEEGDVGQISFFSVDNVGNVEKAVKANLIFDIEEVIDLENIYFAHDSDRLDFEAQKQLDALVEALKKFPEIRIELRSHTDARGSSVYNKQLSKRRAESTRRYMISKGVAPNRLVAKGFGDSKILNHCLKGVQCTNEEHRANRRTEFRIIPFEEE